MILIRIKYFDSYLNMNQNRMDEDKNENIQNSRRNSPTSDNIIRAFRTPQSTANLVDLFGAVQELNRRRSPSSPDIFDPNLVPRIISYQMYDPRNIEHSIPILVAEENVNLLGYLINTGENNQVLSEVIRRGKLNLLSHLVEEAKADIYGVRGPNGNATASLSRPMDALDMAIQFGHLDIVDYLIERGMNSAQHLNKGLVKASIVGNVNMIRYLINRGANVNYNNGEPLWASILTSPNLEVVRCLVEEGGANVRDNAQALIFANEGSQRPSFQGALYEEIVEYLLNMGANPDIIG
jgi:ankyrin repeat protein